MYAQWTTVYITSNSQPADWYPTRHGVMPDGEALNGLLRRLDGEMGEINHFTVPFAGADDGISVDILG